jgi:hypothetical protein
LQKHSTLKLLLFHKETAANGTKPQGKCRCCCCNKAPPFN